MDYNHHCPHGSLNYHTPEAYAEQYQLEGLIFIHSEYTSIPWDGSIKDTQDRRVLQFYRTIEREEISNTQSLR